MPTTKTKEMLVNAIAPMDDLAIATEGPAGYRHRNASENCCVHD